MFHYPTPRPPASHKCLERLNPERNAIAAVVFPCHRCLGHYPNSNKSKIYMLLHCRLINWTLCCHLMPTIARQGGYGVYSYQRWSVTQWSNVMFLDKSKFVLDFHNGQQRVWQWTGEHYQPPAMIAHNHYRGGSVMVWERITMTGRTELHISQGNQVRYHQ